MQDDTIALAPTKTWTSEIQEKYCDDPGKAPEVISVAKATPEEGRIGLGGLSGEEDLRMTLAGGDNKF